MKRLGAAPSNSLHHSQIGYAGRRTSGLLLALSVLEICQHWSTVKITIEKGYKKVNILRILGKVRWFAKQKVNSKSSHYFQKHGKVKLLAKTFIRKIKLYCNTITFRNVFKCKSYLLNKKKKNPQKSQIICSQKKKLERSSYLQVKFQMVTLFSKPLNQKDQVRLQMICKIVKNIKFKELCYRVKTTCKKGKKSQTRYH